MILHVFHSGSVSGPERLVLPALQHIQGAEIVFLVEERLGEAGRDPLRYAEQLGLSCREVRVRSRIDFKAVREVAEIISDKTPEFLHAHDVKATFYARFASWLSTHAPLVCSTHHGVHGRPDIVSKCYERLYRYCLLPLCDRTFAVSSADLETLQASPFLGQKVDLHLNGIRAAKKISTAEIESLRKEWELEKDTVAIGWVGRLSHEKNPLALTAVAEALDTLLASQENDWKICVFGEGPLRGKLQELIEQKGLSEKITLYGYRSNIATEVAALDIVINTSFNEGLPISLLEAGHAGVPICVNATGGMSDLLPEEQFGHTVPVGAPALVFAQQLSLIISNPTLRDSLGKTLRNRVKSLFTEDFWISNLLKQYAQLALLRSESAVPWRSEIKLFPSEWWPKGRSEK